MPTDKSRRRTCPCGCCEYDLPWSGRTFRRSNPARECDTAPTRTPERIIAAATGRRVHGYVSFKADTAMSRDLGELELTANWFTSITAVEEDDSGEAIARPLLIAEAFGTVVRVPPTHRTAFHDACDEVSADISYMGGIVLDNADELDDLGWIADVFYLGHVNVPELRGYRWGVRAAAHLLQAVSIDNTDRFIVAFAGTNADAVDSPNRLAAQRILTDLGMALLDGTDLYVAHPSHPDLADAIGRWLGTPELAAP